MKLSSTRLLSWPSASQKDQCWVQFQDIICVIGAPERQGHSARSYKLSVQDDIQIQQKLPAFL